MAKQKMSKRTKLPGLKSKKYDNAGGRFGKTKGGK
jgi:hypothetical protein